MLSAHPNRSDNKEYTAGSELRIGDVVYINNELLAVKSVGKTGGAILETYAWPIQDISVKPKKYKSAYNSKHGRVW